MDGQARIPRSRGGVCGVLLILLGLWGGLAPLAGPYLHFGFTPDRVWDYHDLGRLYYSVIPAGATLLGGLTVLVTRNRVAGIAGALLAALGGAWFALGDGFVTVVLRRTSISIGQPIAPAGTTGLGAFTLRMYLEEITLFGGLGLLILFFAALAVGRFSLMAADDLPVESDEDDSYYTGLPSVIQTARPGVAASPFPAESDQYVATGQFPRPSSSPPPSVFPDLPSHYPDTSPLSDARTQFPPPEAGGYPG
jgi:hypothetical protein